MTTVTEDGEISKQKRLAALLVTPITVYPVHLDKPTLSLLLQPSMLYQNKVLYFEMQGQKES